MILHILSYQAKNMFIPRVYLAKPFNVGQTIVLEKEDLHYLATVLRLKNHAPLILFNGEGGEYTAQLDLTQKKGAVLIEAYREGQPPPSLNLHLGQSILRGDRMDWVIEKATELGVNEITPLISKNCAVKILPDRLDNRLNHWQKIIISAAEQCGRTTLPQINPPVSLEAFIQQPFAGTSLLFEMDGSSLKAIPKQSAIRLIVGPESGWNEEEITYIKKTSFIHTSLGPRILRAETAGVVALSLLQGFLGDIS